MKLVSYMFFYAYAGVVILAGAWGAFINPHFDYYILFHMDTHLLPDYSRINMMSQYRFLRAIELGFGLFSVIFVRDIFSEKKFNRLFLFIMGSGILARVASIMFDGSPGGLMYFFLIFEVIGWTAIFSYSLNQVYKTQTS